MTATQRRTGSGEGHTPALSISVPALLWLVPGHGTVLLTLMVFLGVSPAFSHSGFDRIAEPGTAGFGAGDYFHHLHHRYSECNYGNRLVPLDKVFGTFHDGTPEAHAQMLARRPSDQASSGG